MEKLCIRVLISLLFLLTDCITPYVSPVTISPPLMVVNGLITDQPGPYAVNIGLTQVASNNYIRTYPFNAHVFIQDDAGNKEELKEVSQGRFETSPTGMQGIVGRKYSVVVILKEGTRYESVPELLRPVSQIEDIYTVFQDLPASSGNAGLFKTYVKTNDPATTGDHYKWTWKHFDVKKYCSQGTRDFDPNIYRHECCEPCWNVVQCESCINVVSDRLANGKRIDQYILDIPYESKEPYYLAVEQLSISESAYNFWKSLNDQVSSVGGVFDPPRAAVHGNLFNVSNGEEQVLGYFGASSVSKTILYVQRDNIEKPPIPPFNGFIVDSGCASCREGYFISRTKPEGWVD
jgi:hypothetical protein